MKAQIVLYIINAIFNAIIFGFLFDLLEEARRTEHAFQAEIDNANTAMSNLHLPDHLQESVRRYINYMHESKLQQEEKKCFAEIVSAAKCDGFNQMSCRKALLESSNMMLLRLYLKKHFRKELAALQLNNLDDPNRQKPDINKGDRNFFNLVESMVSDLKVDHFSPEEVVIM